MNVLSRGSLALVATLWPALAWAHVEGGRAEGFLAGLHHPVSGLDHVLAMVSVGLWGAQLGAPAVWLLPVTFPVVMAFGGMLGLMGVPLPGVEVGIALSGILLGLAVLAEWRPPIWTAAVLVGFVRDLPRPRPRLGAASGSERSRLQHRLRGGHGNAARDRDRNRDPSQVELGASAAARGRCLRGGRRGVLPLAGVRVTGALRFRAFATACLLLLLPAPSHAHLVNTGLGPFYDGVSHFALTPEDLLPALALALLGGQRGSRAGRLALFALPGAWLVGGFLGLALPTIGSAPALTTASFLALGGLVAAEARLRAEWVTLLAVVLGLIHGYLNGSAMSQARLGALGLVGIVSTLFVLVALASALVVALRAPWARIAVRVAGSWIAAVGLLLLGWTFRAV